MALEIMYIAEKTGEFIEWWQWSFSYVRGEVITDRIPCGEIRHALGSVLQMKITALDGLVIMAFGNPKAWSRYVV